MGWSGGSELFMDVISTAKIYIPDNNLRKNFYKELIEAFSAQDWDTEHECLGKDTSYDEALFEIYPEWREHYK